MVTMYSPAGLEIRGLIPARYQGELAVALDGGAELTAYAADSTSEYTLVRLAGEAKPGGVDGFFRAKKPRSTHINPGGLVTLRLKRPPQSSLYRVPPTAIYDNARIYLLRDGRLSGVAVELVGSAILDKESMRLVRGDAIKDGDQLVLTRLPNATTGLKVEALKQ